ncbi:MotA/TolQ/ExbB proton channel family protein [Kiloniella laminariae]|uniref:MotA/TolQ/ExbB proton channel family protein n=2 Tax=Alphaproteobacteria TaxID=28211 RepID=A0ABT4LKM6_9PROT|nr:MotA/TolQ/ExbB proton channel family protein [Kiloniella laminariae]MCZ4280527.1 MotA/TolQ/ExbB proton channel family protein [Kiloniella laminariae]
MANTTTTTPSTVSPQGPSRPQSEAKVDYATLVGIGGAFLTILIAMFLGGSAGSFFNLPSILIVIGGTFLVTTTSFTFDEIVRAQKTMVKAAIYHSEMPSNAAMQVLFLADQARRNSILSLQKHLVDIKNSAFLHRATGMLVDGITPEQLEAVLEQQVQAIQTRHQRAASILRRAGEVAPAMGLIGTLVGLVQMLSNLEDPSTIGPSMAVALLTTFYGAILSNMVFNPLAAKLERISQVEATVNQIYAIGICSIGRQENPRRLEIMMNTILPPDQRVNYFD